MVLEGAVINCERWRILQFNVACVNESKFSFVYYQDPAALVKISQIFGSLFCRWYSLLVGIAQISVCFALGLNQHICFLNFYNQWKKKKKRHNISDHVKVQVAKSITAYSLCLNREVLRLELQWSVFPYSFRLISVKCGICVHQVSAYLFFSIFHMYGSGW